MLKNPNGMRMLESYQHLLPIIRINIEINKEFCWWQVILAFTQKIKRNQNEDEDNCKFLWQGEWNQLLTFVLCKVVFCFEHKLLLHALSLSKHITPNLYKSDQQWQHSSKFKKLSLAMTISIHLHVWQGKRWETPICTWAPLSDVMVTMVCWIVSWAAMCSLLHEQCSNWIPKSSIVWPH
jgi:hypothetical protein